MAKKGKKKEPLVNVFTPRKICGEEVEPFCIPTNFTTVSTMIAAATNLIWWAMHEALADGRNRDAMLCAKILIDIVGRELNEEQQLGAIRLVDEIFEKYKKISDGLN